MYCAFTLVSTDRQVDNRQNSAWLWSVDHIHASMHSLLWLVATETTAIARASKPTRPTLAVSRFRSRALQNTVTKFELKLLSFLEFKAYTDRRTTDGQKGCNMKWASCWKAPKQELSTLVNVLKLLICMVFYYTNVMILNATWIFISLIRHSAGRVLTWLHTNRKDKTADRILFCHVTN